MKIVESDTYEGTQVKRNSSNNLCGGPLIGAAIFYMRAQPDIMDWLTEHWPWLSALVLAVGKMIRDHLAIKDHESRLDKLENVVQQQQILVAEQSADIKHIRNTVDALANRQGITEEDIKDIIRNR